MSSTPNAPAAEAPMVLAQRAMREGAFDEALRLTTTVLENEPESVEALYLKAVSHRYLGQLGDALSAITSLIHLSPEYGRAHQEHGHIHRNAGDLSAAMAAYALAVQYNPALTASWRAIAELSAPNDASASARAIAQAERLEALPKALLAVSNHLYEGRLLKAEELCRAFLKKNPTHVEGMRLLAEIGSRLSVLDDAEFLLENAVALAPDNIQLRLDYIEVLRKRQKFDKAFAEAERLYSSDPENPLYQSHLAIESMQVGDYKRAFELFDAVLARVPNDPATLTSRGHALKTYGRQVEAIESYQAALASRPDHAEAYYALANLKTHQFAATDIEKMREQLAQPGQPLRHSIYLHFALGKALEDQGRYEEAFHHYSEGNRLKRFQTRYRPEQMEEEFAAQRETCTAELFEARQGTGHAASDPIFIVGLPRAGSTLLEQILASHSQVEGTMELPNILALAHRLRSTGPISSKSEYPAVLSELSADELAQFGKAYIDETRVHRKEGRPLFIDKMPNNFRHIGLIHLILPNAKIIDARREPLACCFSGFKQLFAEGQEFTYGLEEVGRYYRAYVELMAHWDKVLPGRVLRVQYEDVIDDLEGQVRRLLDYCGLDFETACLDFHKTQRSVRTASSEQVRQPLYQSGVDQWRHFDPWLDPLKAALGPALTEYRA